MKEKSMGLKPDWKKKKGGKTLEKIKKSSTVLKAAKHGIVVKKKKKKRSESVKKSIVKSMHSTLPKKPEEFSSNWKAFLKTQKDDQPKNQKIGETSDLGKNSDHKKKIKKQKVKTEATTKSSGKPDIWFDDIDEVLLDASSDKQKQDDPEKGLVKPRSFTGITQHVAMDCEMVGTGEDGKDSILARVSLVNHFGQCLYDKFVKPTDDVTDYRTFVSGVTQSDMEAGEEFSVAQKAVHDVINGRILVGHALTNDLKVLFLSHPRSQIRDTSRYRPFRKIFNGRTPGLKALSEKLLGVQVQTGQHSSVQDAQAAMRLYTMYRKQWEKELKNKTNIKKKRKRKKQKQSDSESEDADSS